MQNAKIDKAEHYYNEILKAVPKDEAALTWLGEIHSLLGGARSGLAPADIPQLEEAIGYYDKVLADNAEALTPTVNKRIALLKMRDYWQIKKNAADKDEAAAPKRDKKAKAEAHTRSVDAQAKIDELAPRIEVAAAAVTELIKKRQAKMDGGTPAPDQDGGTSGEDAGMPGGEGKDGG
jgi:tetratricopeptide (TPR) repeat protein